MADRGPFVMIPKCIDDFDLSLAAFRVYAAYKDICGESPDGRCWMTRENLAAKCGVTVPTIVKANKELETKGLIKIDKVQWRGGRNRLMVSVVDVWGRNASVPKAKKLDASPLRERESRQMREQKCFPSDVPEPQNFFPDGSKNSAANESPKNKKEEELYSVSDPLSASEGRRRSCLTQVAKNRNVRVSSVETTKTYGKNRIMEKEHAPKVTDMRGFDLGDSNPEPEETYDDRAALRLINVLAAKFKLLRRAKISVWSKDISEFRRKNEVSEADFEEVLGWYLKHIGEEYVPVVHSAKSFCEKIDQIGLAKRRDDVDSVGSSKEVRAVAQIKRFKDKGL